MSHEIFVKYFIGYLFFCSAHGFDIELYDILYSILCKVYILRIGVLDWHIHCARVWYEILKIVEHSLDFHLGSCKRFDEVENVSGNFYASAFRRWRHYVFGLSARPSKAWNTWVRGPYYQPWPWPEPWPEILHADESWPPSELIRLWSRFVDFFNFVPILT